jgi:hypothetical protein
MHTIQFFPLVATRRAFRSLRSIAAMLVVLTGAFTMAPSLAQAQNTNCVIASNDGNNGFRTDEISGCRVNTATGNATFIMGGENRSRSYAARQPFSQQHIEVATYWLKRSNQLRFHAQYNRAGFDVRAFLEEASRAADGFVLIRTKRSGAQAMNFVYVTDGVYRSIDFDGMNAGEVPSGFLTTGL